MNLVIQIDTELDRDQAAILRGYLSEQAIDAATRITQAGQGRVREYQGLGDDDQDHQGATSYE